MASRVMSTIGLRGLMTVPSVRTSKKNLHAKEKKWFKNEVVLPK